MTLIYLLIEFIDELIFGVQMTAWPVMRDDLRLSYAEIGLLFSVPGIIAAVIEPFIGVLGDVWKRRLLALAGGLVFALSLVLTAASRSFWPLLVSFILFYPASGAFVNLAQANLMDSAPQRHEQNMARWVFSGSAGNLLGPLLLGLVVYFGLGWRAAYAALAGISFFILVAAFRLMPRDREDLPALPSLSGLWSGFRLALAALRRGDVWRWLLLLEFADLMQDILLGFLALYFVDVTGASESGAGAAVLVWVGTGLLTELLFIPYIDRQPDSIRFIRTTAFMQLLAFSLFLTLPSFASKLVAVVFVNLLNTGWYSILQGRLYSALPGQSASIMAIGSVTAPLAKLFPFLVGLLADTFGLGMALWLLLLGPLALIIGLPRRLSTSGSG